MVFDHLTLITHMIVKCTTTDVFHLDVNVVFVFERAAVTYYKRTFFEFVRF